MLRLKELSMVKEKCKELRKICSLREEGKAQEDQISLESNHKDPESQI